MSTAYIKDLIDYNGNIIYPRTKAEAIYDKDGNILTIPKNFIINVTVDSEGNSTADKTYAEILEAYNMGHTLYVNIDSYRLSLAAILNGIFVFTGNLVDIVMSVQISESGVIGDMKFLELVPQASTPDAGKVLMVGDDGNAAWTTIINAEEVAY